MDWIDTITNQDLHTAQKIYPAFSWWLFIYPAYLTLMYQKIESNPDNLVKTYQAAVVGTCCLGLATIPCCQLRVSSDVPELQTPAGTQCWWLLGH